MHVCALCAFSAHRGQKRALAPLELELQMLASRHVGAVNLTGLSLEPVAHTVS